MVKAILKILGVVALILAYYALVFMAVFVSESIVKGIANFLSHKESAYKGMTVYNGKAKRLNKSRAIVLKGAK